MHSHGSPMSVLRSRLLRFATIAMLLWTLAANAAPSPIDRPGYLPPEQQTPAESAQSSLTQQKWIGLTLAISSSLAIGTSFIITKKGLMDAADKHNALASDGHTYLQNPIWWAGMATMIVGEVANFAAYTFAPPILVTPLGALSVLIGAILASFILKEELGRLGKVGCTLCLVGTVIIVVNAPEDKEIQTIDEMLNYALQPGFLFYCTFVLGFSLFMIFRMVPKYGRKTPLVYISICSLVGSISVMSVKGLGVALKLTFAGNNQFTHPSTYCFAIVVIVCILTQMNYFNKALDQFSTNVVNPIYYVFFTTSTILASVLLFQGFNTTTAPAVSLLGGFIVIFTGVYLLNLNRIIDPVTQQPRMSLVTGEGTTRLSEQHERLLDQQRAMSSFANGRTSLSGPSGRSATVFGHGRRSSAGSSVLFNAYEDEEALGMTRLDEDEYEDDLRDTSPMIRQGKARSARAHDANGHRPSAETTARSQRQLKRQSLIDDATPNYETGK
ncbi:hypothetical protein EX895_005646 [Sporisorium graminicola]|uniref:DUF803-domain-containing protein n=1 Tax=Sporisorium graminicola TaxID=280036 RepID=A0A4U7KMS5_9BASI|nr:hypothetical protein EX895_005646 [Sporisorium graminicola]TKY85484.1 hypothetical protein EX895_005646 [Sporisorium graminicola]